MGLSTEHNTSLKKPHKEVFLADKSLFYPKCLDDSGYTKPMSTSAKGYLLPCCWSDDEDISDPENTHYIFIAEHLKISNFSSLQEILDTPEWVEFLRRIQEKETDKLPRCCMRECYNKNHKSKVDITIEDLKE
jgi:hypothetical protein